MHNRSHFHLGALIAMALSGLGLHTDLREAERAARDWPQSHRRNRKAVGAWGSSQKRYHVIRKGRRVALPAGSPRPACPFIPNVAGYRYEHGHYVRR